MAVGTPFHPRTSALNKSLNWRHWSGYFTAGCYHDFIQPEYAAIRNKAALIDVSPLYKYSVEGPGATALMQRVFTRDVSKCSPMQAIYTPWCDSGGQVMQEGTVFRLDDDSYQVNAAEPTMRWLRLNSAGLDLTIADRSAAVAALALQGPTSRRILNACFDGDVDGLRFFHLVAGTIGSVPVTVSRTGYTGDLGYEVWIPADRAIAVWDALLDVGQPHGITPCGILAMDVARVEAGFILIDVDYISAERALIPEHTSSPYELGLGWAVKLDKGNFVGRDALVAESARGAGRRVVGICIDWEPLEEIHAADNLMPDLPQLACREPVPVYAAEGQVGRVTTRCWSTLLKKYIGIATVEACYASPGTAVEMELTVNFRRRRVPAAVVQLPHFRPPRMRE
ncbi:MAG: aminomethyl transferase family protein [Acidobacteria bacterium]|nr:aminomethyl transferase family protein [Acidobacteriota bacterium]